MQNASKIRYYYMVTDSGADFVKAFKHFSLDKAEELATEQSEVTEINKRTGR